MNREHIDLIREAIDDLGPDRFYDMCQQYYSNEFFRPDCYGEISMQSVPVKVAQMHRAMVDVYDSIGVIWTPG